MTSLKGGRGGERGSCLLIGTSAESMTRKRKQEVAHNRDDQGETTPVKASAVDGTMLVDG